MANEFWLCENILFRGDYQETRSVCVAYASRIIACLLGSGWRVPPRISVFSIPPLKFSQSTRRADWNSREKNVSYAPGDSSKYFRQLPFLFLLLFLFVSPSPAPRTNEVERIIVSCRVRENGLKEEERHGLHERYVGSYFVMPNSRMSRMNTETDLPQVSRRGFTKDPLIPFIETLHIDFDSPANNKKMISNGFRNYKISCWNVRIPA